MSVRTAPPLPVLLRGLQVSWVHSPPQLPCHTQTLLLCIEVLAKAQFCPQEAGVVEES